MVTKNSDNVAQFKRLADLQERSIKIQEQDLVKRAEADKVSVSNKDLDIESTRADFYINIRKADRGIREQWLTTVGHAFGVTAFAPQKGNFRPLMTTVALARSFIGIYDAYRDRDDIVQKQSDYENTVGLPKDSSTEQTGLHVDRSEERNFLQKVWDRARHQRDDRTTTRITKVGLFAGGPSGGTASGPA